MSPKEESIIESNNHQTAPPVPVDESVLNVLKNILKENAAALLKLSNQFEERIAYDSVKEKAFNTLYDELKQYKENFLFLSQKTIFNEIILLLDNIQKMNSDLRAKEEQLDDVTSIISFVEEELLEILYRHDVVPGDSETLYYQPGLQKAIETIPTPDEKEHNRVVKTIRRGYKWGEKIFRPAEVIIKKYNL